MLSVKQGSIKYNFSSVFSMTRPEIQHSTHKANRLSIDQNIDKKNKTKQKNVTVLWIDYKKTYDIHSWIIDN